MTRMRRRGRRGARQPLGRTSPEAARAGATEKRTWTSTRWHWGRWGRRREEG